MDNRTAAFQKMIQNYRYNCRGKLWSLSNILEGVEFDDALDVFVLTFGAPSDEVDCLYEWYGKGKS